MSKIDEIYDALVNDMEFKGVERDDDDGLTVVTVGIPVKDKTFRMIFFSDNDPKSESISFRIFNVASFDESKKALALETVNKINGDYNLLKFTLDDDLDVRVEFDFLDSNLSSKGTATEVIVRSVNILEDVYPILMKAQWS